jgi:uncharacterized phage-associated protein
VFGQFAAWKLRNMTQEESPGKLAAQNSATITHQSLKEYFKTQLNCEEGV